MTRIYLAGPMTGIEGFNFPAFHERADALEARGYDVVNPADHGDSESWGYYIRKDLALLLECDAVAVLPGWQGSKGASLEVHVARTLEMPVYDAHTMTALDPPSRENILQEAQRLTSSDRNQDYGPPHLHHGATAGMVDSMLRRMGWDGPALEARDWQRFIIADKLIRDIERPKRDCEVDIAGYARCMEMTREATA